MSKIIEAGLAGTDSNPGADRHKLARELAIRQIEHIRAFRIHAATYAVGVVFLVVIWAMSEYHNAGGWPVHGFSQSSGLHDVWNFWIIYPVLGWGAFVALHGWFSYLRRPVSEGEIQREMERHSSVRPERRT